MFPTNWHRTWSCLLVNESTEENVLQNKQKHYYWLLRIKYHTQEKYLALLIFIYYLELRQQGQAIQVRAKSNGRTTKPNQNANIWQRQNQSE